jgi:hypothetical protein
MSRLCLQGDAMNGCTSKNGDAFVHLRNDDLCKKAIEFKSLRSLINIIQEYGHPACTYPCSTVDIG